MLNRDVYMGLVRQDMQGDSWEGDFALPTTTSCWCNEAARYIGRVVKAELARQQQVYDARLREEEDGKLLNCSSRAIIPGVVFNESFIKETGRQPGSVFKADTLRARKRVAVTNMFTANTVASLPSDRSSLLSTDAAD
eukprot:Selendium_serpulae@DN4287_c0_g1_i3.p1